MNTETIATIAVREFERVPKVDSGPGRYLGTSLPLVGMLSVETTDGDITVDLVDRSNWEQRALLGVVGPITSLAELFRPTRPNRIIGEGEFGAIVPDSGGWRGRGAIFVGRNSHYESQATWAAFRFRIETLTVYGPSIGCDVAAVRTIYSRGNIGANGTFRGQPILLRGLTSESTAIGKEMMAVTTPWNPQDLELEAIWNMLSLLCGNTVRALATQYFADDGSLIKTDYRLGADTDDRRQRHFHRFYGPLAVDGVEQLTEGIYRLLTANFPIEVVLQHLREAAHRAIDIDAQHLVLGIHAVIEGWNRSFGVDYWYDDKSWEKRQKELRRALPKELLEDLTDPMRDSLRSSIRHANRTTTAWRQAQLFSALNIDVSDRDSQRALKLRNELLHNGYFLERWFDLTPEKRQERFDDIERLRRLLLIIIFKLTAYQGSFMNPFTKTSENVERCTLPPQLMP